MGLTLGNERIGFHCFMIGIVMNKYFTLFFGFVTLAFASLITLPASAQSVCKGLSKSACTSNSKCSHVAAFTRSDGAKVKAFCRAKPGQATNASAKKKKPAKKASTTKSKTTKAKTTKAGTKKKESASSAKKPEKKKTTKKASTKKASTSKSKTKTASKKKTTTKKKSTAKKKKKKATPSS